MSSKGIASQACFAFLRRNAFHYIFHFVLVLNMSVKCMKVQSRAVGFSLFSFCFQVVILETNDRYLEKAKSNTSCVSIE